MPPRGSGPAARCAFATSAPSRIGRDSQHQPGDPLRTSADYSISQSSPLPPAQTAPLRSVETIGGPWWIPTLALQYGDAAAPATTCGGGYTIEPLGVRHRLEIAPGERIIGLRVRSGWWIDGLAFYTDRGRAVALGGRASSVAEVEELPPAPGAFLAGFEVVVGVEVDKEGRDKLGAEHVMGLTSLWAVVAAPEVPATV